MGFTRPRSSRGVDHGAISRQSSSLRSNGSTGSTIEGCWSRSETFRRPKPKRAIMRNSTSPPSRRDSNEMASGKPGAVHAQSPDSSLLFFNSISGPFAESLFDKRGFSGGRDDFARSVNDPIKQHSAEHAVPYSNIAKLHRRSFRHEESSQSEKLHRELLGAITRLFGPALWNLSLNRLQAAALL